ncbi:MAG: prepilin-type N-terminal cleavage/methylation domain-containing protein [Halioglobus sp.]
MRSFSSMRRRPATSRGFSLLEMMVAIAILALSLGTLYQAVSGATRNVRSDEKYAYGVELAKSLLSDNSRVSSGGVNKHGETAGGFAWQVASQPLSAEAPGFAQKALRDLKVSVDWQDGQKRRGVVLQSVVEVYGQ